MVFGYQWRQGCILGGRNKTLQAQVILDCRGHEKITDFQHGLRCLRLKTITWGMRKSPSRGQMMRVFFWRDIRAKPMVVMPMGYRPRLAEIRH